MSGDLKTLIGRLPPEMENDLKQRVKFLLRPSAARSRRKPRLLLKNLGWTQQQIQEARCRLASFEDDWDYPGMEKYDELRENRRAWQSGSTYAI